MSNKDRLLILDYEMQIAINTGDEKCSSPLFGGIEILSDKEVRSRETLASNAMHVKNLKEAMAKKNLSEKDTVILILNVEDRIGYGIISLFVPNFSPQKIPKGADHFFRALINRDYIFRIISAFDQKAAVKLMCISNTAVVLVDNDNVEVYPA